MFLNKRTLKCTIKQKPNIFVSNRDDIVEKVWFLSFLLYIVKIIFEINEHVRLNKRTYSRSISRWKWLKILDENGSTITRNDSKTRSTKQHNRTKLFPLLSLQHLLISSIFSLLLKISEIRQVRAFMLQIYDAANF